MHCFNYTIAGCNQILPALPKKKGQETPSADSFALLNREQRTTRPSALRLIFTSTALVNPRLSFQYANAPASPGLRSPHLHTLEMHLSTLASTHRQFGFTATPTTPVVSLRYACATELVRRLCQYSLAPGHATTPSAANGATRRHAVRIITRLHDALAVPCKSPKRKGAVGEEAVFFFFFFLFFFFFFFCACGSA